jgi:uncharacterized protein (DUF433 family)
MIAKEVSPGVTVNPKVKGGDPCIKGTGIPTRIIAQRFVAGEQICALADDYDLRAYMIDAALRWELLDRDARRRRIKKALGTE